MAWRIACPRHFLYLPVLHDCSSLILTIVCFVWCVLVLWCLIVCHRRHGLLLLGGEGLRLGVDGLCFVGGRHASDQGLQACAVPAEHRWVCGFAGLRVMWGVWRSGCVGGPCSQATPAPTRAGYVWCLAMLWYLIVCHRRHGLLLLGGEGLRLGVDGLCFVGGRHASDQGLQACAVPTEYVPCGLGVL